MQKTAKYSIEISYNEDPGYHPFTVVLTGKNLEEEKVGDDIHRPGLNEFSGKSIKKLLSDVTHRILEIEGF